MAAFNNMVHRLTRIPLNQSGFQKELMTIKHLARVNGVCMDALIPRLQSPWFEFRQEGAVDEAPVFVQVFQ